MIQTIVVAIITILLLCLYVVVDLRSERRRSARIAARRKPLAFAEWLQVQNATFADDDKPLVEELIGIIGDCYAVPPTSLNIRDRFTGELGLKSLISLGDDSFETLQEAFEKQFGIEWNINWASIADVIDALLSGKST